MAITYSAWTWSAEQGKHYCAVYDNGTLIEYHWEGGYRQKVQAAQPADSNPRYQPEVDSQVRAQSAAQAESPRQTAATPVSRDSGVGVYTYGTNYTTGSYQNTSSSQTQYYGQQQSNTNTQPQIYGQPYPNVRSNSDPLPDNVQQTVGAIISSRGSRQLRTGDDGLNHERLHPSFRRVSAHDQERFFVRGRVFKMLWTEPAGQVHPGQTRGSTHYSLVRFQEGAWSEIRRFVVIQNKGTFSQCIPVQTYRGQGATKPGLVVADHAVIYTSRHYPPQTFRGEEAINKQPIRVNPYKHESLEPASRINFGKPYAVEHNVKLCEIGVVDEAHLHLLVNYFMEAMGLS